MNDPMVASFATIVLCFVVTVVLAVCDLGDAGATPSRGSGSSSGSGSPAGASPPTDAARGSSPEPSPPALPDFTAQELWELREDARDMFYHAYDSYMKYGCAAA